MLQTPEGPTPVQLIQCPANHEQHPSPDGPIKGTLPPQLRRTKVIGWPSSRKCHSAGRSTLARCPRTQKVLQLQQTRTLRQRVPHSKESSILTSVCPRLHGPGRRPLECSAGDTPHQPVGQCPLGLRHSSPRTEGHPHHTV